MEWITDTDLKVLLGSSRPPIVGVDLTSSPNDIGAQVQPCSVDLRIDEIFLPMANPSDSLNRVAKTSEHELAVGQSVKVSTKERFDFDNRHAGILFAPARLSRRGIVVPDIGHIDPGFDKNIRLTLINMGRDPYLLKSGDVVGTVLVFRLHKECAYGLNQRQGLQPYLGGLDDIRHLSPDFLNITQTVKALAKTETERALGVSGWRYAFYSLFLPILIAGAIGVLIAIATYYFQVSHDLESFRITTEAKIESLDKRSDAAKSITDLRDEYKSNQAALDQRMEAMQRQLNEVAPTRAKRP